MDLSNLLMQEYPNLYCPRETIHRFIYKPVGLLGNVHKFVSVFPMTLLTLVFDVGEGILQVMFSTSEKFQII